MSRKKVKKTRKMLEIEERIGEPIDKFLRREYKTRSTSEIGKDLGVSGEAIGNWMRNYDIKVRKPEERKNKGKIKKPSKEELQELYGELRNAHKIAKKYGVYGSTVGNWMEEYGIERGIKKLSKEKLKKLYDESKSVKEVAERHGVGQSTIFKWMNEYKLSRRDSSKS